MPVDGSAARPRGAVRLRYLRTPEFEPSDIGGAVLWRASALPNVRGNVIPCSLVVGAARWM
jgi:hypothetical protein